MKRASAVLEVTVVTALTWAAYKAMKLVEPGNFNVSPGLAMLVAAGILIAWRRREFAAYGIVSPEWRSGLNLGVVLGLLMLLGGALELALFPDSLLPPTHQPVHLAYRLAVFRVPLYLSVLLALSRLRPRPLERMPLAATLLILAVLLVAAPAFAVYRGAALPDVVGRAAALVFCTGLGEELFFRGYIQSHLNVVFGRPWRLLGASVGPGLLISSLLFGAIHLFNPTRPYSGHWELSWIWGAGTCFIGGPLYGYLRELSGSVWTATVIHSLGGEYRGLGQVFLAKR